MNTSILKFSFTCPEDIRAFAKLIRELNEAGVPYESKQSSSNNLDVELEISTGY